MKQFLVTVGNSVDRAVRCEEELSVTEALINVNCAKMHFLVHQMNASIVQHSLKYDYVYYHYNYNILLPSHNSIHLSINRTTPTKHKSRVI